MQLPDDMEIASESINNHANKNEVSEKKQESDIASDRESSIESFHTNKSEISNTTETDFIDVDDIELSDEESWLYKSPKKMSVDEKVVNTYNWLHKDVKDMDDLQLQATKTALITKLNQLKFLDSRSKAKVAESQVLKERPCDNSKPSTANKTTVSKESDLHLAEAPKKEEKICSKMVSETDSRKENEFLDVVDVQKIARLQEESLKQSTSRFLSNAEKKFCEGKTLSSSFCGLSKPASVEALNTYSTKTSQADINALVPMQGMKKQNMFGSSATLHHYQDIHRGSLPNINKGYYSLKSKKSKQSSDQKRPCPLPIYPSHLKAAGTSLHEVSSESHSKLLSPPNDRRESHTLPSSYRVHSRSNSSSRRDLNASSPSPRRESTPFLPHQRNTPLIDMNRRESAPCNPRKIVSPIASPTLFHRCTSSSPVLQNPTKSYTSAPHKLRSPTHTDYHRNPSHSPARRMPLTTVHNYSPKVGNCPTSPRNGEIQTLKLPSKIPSPASRSGIPVPSFNHISKSSPDDETWSQDCF